MKSKYHWSINIILTVFSFTRLQSEPEANGQEKQQIFACITEGRVFTVTHKEQLEQISNDPQTACPPNDEHARHVSVQVGASTFMCMCLQACFLRPHHRNQMEPINTSGAGEHAR